MEADLSRFRVIYKERVLNAVSLRFCEFSSDDPFVEHGIARPKFIEMYAINSDGNLVLLRDEAWMFQFVPIVAKGGGADG